MVLVMSNDDDDVALEDTIIFHLVLPETEGYAVDPNSATLLRRTTVEIADDDGEYCIPFYHHANVCVSSPSG